MQQLCLPRQHKDSSITAAATQPRNYLTRRRRRRKIVKGKLFFFSMLSRNLLTHSKGTRATSQRNKLYISCPLSWNKYGTVWHREICCDTIEHISLLNVDIFKFDLPNSEKTLSSYPLFRISWTIWTLPNHLFSELAASLNYQLISSYQLIKTSWSFLGAVDPESWKSKNVCNTQAYFDKRKRKHNNNNKKLCNWNIPFWCRLKALLICYQYYYYVAIFWSLKKQ